MFVTAETSHALTGPYFASACGLCKKSALAVPPPSSQNAFTASLIVSFVSGGRARVPVQLGDGGRREATADGLVQHDLYGAALDVERVVVEALPPPHPSATRGVVQVAVGGVPAFVAAEVFEP